VGEITPAVTGSRGEEIAGGGRRVTWPGRRGPRASERKRKGVYRFGFSLLGRRPRVVLGLKAPPGSFYIFICLLPFLFLVFPISFVSFAKRLQINSNHFQGFSKIQSIKVGQ
jgi:hypothetical protein